MQVIVTVICSFFCFVACCFDHMCLHIFLNLFYYREGFVVECDEYYPPDIKEVADLKTRFVVNFEYYEYLV